MQRPAPLPKLVRALAVLALVGCGPGTESASESGSASESATASEGGSASESGSASGTGTGSTSEGTESETGNQMVPGEDCELRTEESCNDPFELGTPMCSWTEVTRVSAEQADSCPAIEELETTHLCLAVTQSGDPGCASLPMCSASIGVRPEDDGGALFVYTCGVSVDGFGTCASGDPDLASHAGCVCVCG